MACQHCQINIHQKHIQGIETAIILYLVVVERRVVDGEQLGAPATGVEAVPHGDGAEEHPQPEQWPVRDAQRGARHAHGVKV